MSAAVAAAAMPRVMKCRSRQLQNPTPQTEDEKEAEFIDEPKYDRADIYSDDEFHSDETEKGDGELPAAKPAKHVKLSAKTLQTFRKPQNLRKRTIGCKNTPKGVTARPKI